MPRLLPAARTVTNDRFSATVISRDRAAWGRLCRLLTDGRRRARKGSCDIRFSDLTHWGEGLELIVHPGGCIDWRSRLEKLVAQFPGFVTLALAPRYDGQDPARFDRLASLAAGLGVETVATVRPIMHHGSRRRLTDVLTAIRTGTRVDDLGRGALHLFARPVAL